MLVERYEPVALPLVSRNLVGPEFASDDYHAGTMVGAAWLIVPSVEETFCNGQCPEEAQICICWQLYRCLLMCLFYLLFLFVCCFYCFFFK